METVYDWITVTIFAGLVTRFLQLSAKPEARNDKLWHYLAASVGCAAANWFGNNGQHLVAIALLGATLAYAFHFIGPRRSQPSDH